VTHGHKRSTSGVSDPAVALPCISLRTLVTAVASLLFIVGFPVVLFVDSAVRYARDGEALVESARSSALREALVDATAALVVSEVSREPGLDAVNRVFIRGGIDHVLSAEWFDGSIRSVHAAAMTSARGAARTAEVDLEPFKQALSGRLGLVGARASETCRPLFGPQLCADHGRAQQLIERYRQRAHRATARIPDRLLLWPDAAGGEDLNLLAAIRWVGLGLVVASAIALLFLLRRRPAALGAIVVAATGVFLVLALALRLTASGPVSRFLIARAGLAQRDDQPISIATAGLQRFASDIVADATRDGLIVAAVLAAVGVVLVATRYRRAAGRTE
jgi:hypothetical protein